MKYSINIATKEQMAEVAKVFKLSRSYSLPYLPKLHTEEEDVYFFTNVVYKKNNVHLAKSDSEEKILGFIVFNDSFVDHLYLLPEFQGKGIGTELLKIAMEKNDSLKLWTFQKNQKAILFYEKNGFSPIEKTNVEGNEEKEPDALLFWEK